MVTQKGLKRLGLRDLTQAKWAMITFVFGDVKVLFSNSGKLQITGDLIEVSRFPVRRSFSFHDLSKAAEVIRFLERNLTGLGVPLRRRLGGTRWQGLR